MIAATGCSPGSNETPDTGAPAVALAESDESVSHHRVTDQPVNRRWEVIPVLLDEKFFAGQPIRLARPEGRPTTITSMRGMQTRQSNGNRLVNFNFGKPSKFSVSELPYQDKPTDLTTPLLFQHAGTLFDVKQAPLALPLYGDMNLPGLETTSRRNNNFWINGGLLQIDNGRVTYQGRRQSFESISPAGFYAFNILASDYRDGRLYLHVLDLNGDSRVGLCSHYPENDLLVCEFYPVRTKSGFASWMLHATEHGVYISDNIGNFDFFSFNTRTVVSLSATAATTLGVTQFYSSAEDSDFVYFGHYPTADVLRCEKRSQHCAFLNLELSKEDGIHRDEVQSLIKFGDTLYTGVWPWGEVFATDLTATSERTRKVFRAFRAPELDPNTLHPWRERSAELRACFGQRITQLVPMNSGFVVVTGNLHNECQAILRSGLNDDEYEQYGRLYFVETDVDLTCELSDSTAPTLAVIIITGDAVSVANNGKIICSRPRTSAI